MLTVCCVILFRALLVPPDPKVSMDSVVLSVSLDSVESVVLLVCLDKL